VKLTTHLLPMPRSRRRGAIPPPQYVFMVWCLVKHRENLLIFSFILVKSADKTKFQCQQRSTYDKLQLSVKVSRSFHLRSIKIIGLKLVESTFKMLLIVIFINIIIVYVYRWLRYFWCFAFINLKFQTTNAVS
jgi:hypothetical protein